jgi:hypothetical protein
MIYREYLVMRKALVWFAGITVLIELLDLLFPPKGLQKVPWDDVVVTAGVFAACFAWIFAVALGNGSRQAARVLWVLPAERRKVALQVIAVDFAGIVAAFIWFCAIDVLMLAVPSEKAQLRGPLTGSAAAFVLTGIFAIYGWGALVGIIGRRMPYAAIIATPALAIWLTIAEQKFAISPIFRAPILANPFAVINTRTALQAWQEHHWAIDIVSRQLIWLGTTWETPVLAAITIATCGLAILLWQRAQVIF